MRRLFLLAVVILGLAPTTWLRSPRTPSDNRQIVTVTPLAVPPGHLGPLRLVGAWQLDSPHRHFHGYSALAVLGDGMLLVASDRSRVLHLAQPGQPPRPVRL